MKKEPKTESIELKWAQINYRVTDSTLPIQSTLEQNRVENFAADNVRKEPKQLLMSSLRMWGFGSQEVSNTWSNEVQNNMSVPQRTSTGWQRKQEYFNECHKKYENPIGTSRHIWKLGWKGQVRQFPAGKKSSLIYALTLC